MFKTIFNEVWAFDAEWVPDPVAGRLVYGLPEDTPDRAVLEYMWEKGGASDEDPYPYLKTALCRVVSVSALQRRVRADGSIELNLLWLPRDPSDSLQANETHVVGTFLNAIGSKKPQLVGYNSTSADLKIMLQRGIILGIQAAEFSARPDKPWEGSDYFARDNDCNIDLMRLLGSWGRGSPSLHEMAVQSGIPGKLDADGQMVAQMWLDGRLADIVGYNNYDALTTYLLWLRVAHFAGHFGSQAYDEEQERVRQLVLDLMDQPGMAYLERYVEEWDRLRGAVAAK